jgi:LssY C-terminus
MRILLGLGRGLAFLSLLGCASAAIGCDQLPAGQAMWVRLASPVSTYTAQVGDSVRAVLTQDVICGRDVVLPMGTQIAGVVRSKRKVGWGIRHETAALELEFNEAVYEDGSTIALSARVEEIENAREQVKHGVIQGVLSSDTFQGRINSRLIHLPTWNPYSDLGLIIYKATFPIFPEPEIYYPAGTDIRLKTTSPVSSLPMLVKDVPDAIPSETSQLDAWVQQIPQRSTTKKSVSADLLNLVFLGSREQVQAAFHEAGWHNSDPVSKHSFERNFYALLNNSGYAQQPMTNLLLDGKPEDMNWQKGLNSYGRRDHLRIWEWTPEGANDGVWLSSSTHDTGAVLSVKYKGFVHHIAPDIDEERAKVVRDLNFVGCVKSVTYVSRSGLSMTTQNATGDVMFTDGSIAVIQLQDCQPVSPELDGNSTAANFKPGNHAFRYLRREILTFRNDIWRANIIYGIYDVGRMTVNALRRQPTVVPPAETQTVVPLVARSTLLEAAN